MRGAMSSGCHFCAGAMSSGCHFGGCHFGWVPLREETFLLTPDWVGAILGGVISREYHFITCGSTRNDTFQ